MSSSNLPLGAVAQPSPSPLGTPSLPEGPARPPPGALRSLKARAQSAKASRANSTPFGFVAAPHLRTLYDAMAKMSWLTAMAPVRAVSNALLERLFESTRRPAT